MAVMDRCGADWQDGARRLGMFWSVPVWFDMAVRAGSGPARYGRTWRLGLGGASKGAEHSVGLVTVRIGGLGSIGFVSMT